MEIKYRDYNNADRAIHTTYQAHWRELESILSAMPLIVQQSRQKGKVGTPVFDPKGTNLHIKEELNRLGWATAVLIPDEFRFLGTDVDFAKNGILGETQFAHYGLLVNNLIRSELFFNARTVFHRDPTDILFYITKSNIFPSANSSLYYEQAVNQFDAFARNRVFDIPIRLIGLFSPFDVRIPVRQVEYEGRTSRTSISNQELEGVLASPLPNRRPVLTVLSDNEVVGQAEAQPENPEPPQNLFGEN